MQKKKMLVQAAAVLSATALSASPVLAAGWQKDATGWWWQEDNGGYPVNKWQWLDGNDDGTAESYYFGDNGYMYMNAKTPDGYQVNGDGQWMENGNVQTKLVRMSGNWKQETGANGGRWYWEKGNGQRLGAGWHWLDGNSDGVFECYYIGQDGYMVANGKTPDGYDVNADGAWTVGGKIQAKGNAGGPVGGTGSTTTTSKGGSGGGGGGGSHSSGGGGGHSSGGGSSSGGSSSSSSSDRDESVKYGANDPDTGNYGKMTDSERRAVADAIAKFKADYGIDSKDDLQKELAILKWLTSNCKYKAKGWSTSTAYSCIVEGQAQCAGYADAFLQTAKACGLEAKYILNDNHAWNLVKIGGQWYHVDATWEDTDTQSRTLCNKYINLSDTQIKRLDDHKSWTPSSLRASSTLYDNGQIMEYALATGMTDTSMTGDNYRIWLMDNPKLQVYNNLHDLSYVGAKLDSGSNYFADPAQMTDRMVNYLQSRFESGKYAYMTFPKGTDTKWLTKTWLEDHVGGSGYNYVQHEATHDDTYDTILIKNPSAVLNDEEAAAKLQEALTASGHAAITSRDEAVAYLTEQARKQETTVTVVYAGTDESIMVDKNVKGATGVKEINRCNAKTEKVRVDGQMYTIRTYTLTYASLKDVLISSLESDNENLIVDVANGINANGKTLEEVYADRIRNAHGTVSFDLVLKGSDDGNYTQRFEQMIAASGIKLQGKVKRDAAVDRDEYNGVTYYVDRYSYVRLSGKDDIINKMAEEYHDAEVITFTNADETAQKIFDYTKQVFLAARNSQQVGETVYAYYVIDLPEGTADDTYDLRGKLMQLSKNDLTFANTEYQIYYPTMSRRMIYDGGTLYPCAATQRRISDHATVAAVANLLMEDQDLVSAPTEDQKKEEKTTVQEGGSTLGDSSDSMNVMDTDDEEKSKGNQTEEPKKLEKSEKSEELAKPEEQAKPDITEE